MSSWLSEEDYVPFDWSPKPKMNPPMALAHTYNSNGFLSTFADTKNCPCSTCRDVRAKAAEDEEVNIKLKQSQVDTLVESLRQELARLIQLRDEVDKSSFKDAEEEEKTAGQHLWEQISKKIEEIDEILAVLEDRF